MASGLRRASQPHGLLRGASGSVLARAQPSSAGQARRDADGDCACACAVSERASEGGLRSY